MAGITRGGGLNGCNLGLRSRCTRGYTCGPCLLSGEAWIRGKPVAGRSSGSQYLAVSGCGYGIWMDGWVVARGVLGVLDGWWWGLMCGGFVGVSCRQLCGWGG